ncbi:NADH-quinone oxidoreductase subunit NuoH [bacterium]|nr:NADH-quinone oxidoreductase subunit NuoH [bacterium]
MVVPIVLIITVFPGIFAYVTLVERKSLARFQNRRGPNRVGKWGLLQPIADGLKVLTKEDIVPQQADRLVHFLAPVLVVVPALVVLAVVPVAPGYVPVNLQIGLLFALAVSTVSVVALFMAGWASRNKFSLLGAMRAVAQVVSYEVPTVLAAVAVVMAAGSLSTLDIVEAQRGRLVPGISGWYVWQPWGFIGFILFFMGTMAESARTPFDLPEAESEIIAGYHTEYSGFKFALFQMAEYLATLGMAGVTVTLFLGGYQGPGAGPTGLGIAVGIGWFFLKLFALVFVIIWVRGTWPRIRVDQLLGFAWKLLLPMSLVNIVAAASWRFLGGGVLAWVATAVWLALWWLSLARLAGRTRLEQRTYRYAT